MAKHSARGTDWAKQRQRVLDRDLWECGYCHKHLEGPDATVDHIEPISIDPERTYQDDELIAACRSCNGRKQDRTGIRTHYRNPRWF